MPPTLPHPKDALDLLRSLGAPEHLNLHHELVLEAATAIVEGIADVAPDLDARLVLVGAALHDVGKIIHPDEMTGPGKSHEAAGEKLLLDHGVDPTVARLCAVHGVWNRADATLEELLVTLSDKLWKGNRVHGLEERVVEAVTAKAGIGYWDVDAVLTPVFEEVASQGDEWLVRSRGE